MTNPELTDQTALIQQLLTAIASVTADDLPVLAKMHGWSMALADMDEAQRAPAVEMTQLLESLILGTCENPKVALQRIGELITGFAAPPGSESAPPSAPIDAAECETAPAENVLEDLLNQLAAAARTVDQHDLTRLAEMHTSCEQLIAAAKNTSDPATTARSQQIVSAIEDVILSVADNSDSAMSGIAEQIDELIEHVARSDAPTDFANLTDDQLKEQLAGLLDQTSASDAAAVAPPSESPTAAPTQQAPENAKTESPVTTGPPAYVAEPLHIDPSEAEFVAAFVEEAGEHIANIETALLEVEQAPEDTEKINELFRPFHTIKGMAGFLNLRDVNCLTHEVETLLDQGRRGDRRMTPGIIDIVFTVIDKLKAQIAAIANYVNHPDGNAVPQPPVAEMIEHLRGVIAGDIDTEEAKPTPATPPTTPSATEDATTSPPAAPADDGGTASPTASSTPTTPNASNTPSAASASGLGGASKAAAALGEQSVRIDTDKLDALVDMVGELVIAQTLISANEKIATDPRLNKDASQVSKIVRDVQEVAMSMRMIPIKSTFQKMARLVRDLSRKAGKQVELIISGEETELDKNVIQQIGDPLVHMVRNAVDHGIEAPDVRTKHGKPPTGRIHLNAFHHGGNIVIEISDDGKGLDAAGLVAKAVEKGILQPDEELTEDQAYHLVFAPGFSTAAQITDISGRGVGMDVVKRNIEQLRGRVEIQSEKGKGSTFSIRLPLTLAIIDGMLVRLGNERFIIATTAIEQALRPRPEQITTVQQRGEVLQVRGRLIPLVQFGPMFKMSRRIDPTSAMVVIAHSDRGPIGLVVEELIGQQQVVIKSLGERFRDLRGVSGAAILGDGRVGLILDASGIFSAYEGWRGASIATPTPVAKPPIEQTPEPSLAATCTAAHSADIEPTQTPAGV